MKIQAQAHCNHPLCWYLCWYRQAKHAAANFDIPDEGIKRRHAPFTTFRVTFGRQPQLTNPGWLAIEERERVHDCFDADQAFSLRRGSD
ncbi:hypothetical protein [Bradyrhizobium ganzhouense]|uniref:hypothetical protein n=1 Tax=Bradyrhizobium ganzhouense TaxID=1179767 RepID=UPI003CEBB8FD